MFEVASLKGIVVRKYHFGLPLLSKKCKRFRLLYISDLHFSFWTHHVLQQLIDVFNACPVDMVVLGGDLVDFTVGLKQLQAFVSQLTKKSTIYALPGNHDQFVGWEKVLDVLKSEGVRTFSSRKVQVHGYKRPLYLVNQIRNSSDHEFTVLCTHDPKVFSQAAENNIDLVLAGHLHGSQVVLWENKNDLYPGRLFFRWNCLESQIKKSKLLVSRGVNDTLPIRYNCPREVILCTF